MKKHLRSVFCLLAPSLALMALAFYFSRRAAVAPSAIESGPFKLKIAGVEAQKIEPYQAFNGYSHRFQLVFEAHGSRPAGWGTFSGARSGLTNQTKWKFWIERNKKRTAFVPDKVQVWTSDWDKDHKSYTNEFLFHGGAVPDDAALKMSGTSQIAVSGGSPATLGPPIPFEVTLKKAGQKWRAPHVSTDAGMVVQKVVIQKPRNGRTVAIVTLLLTSGAEFNASSLSSLNFLDGNWVDQRNSVKASASVSSGGQPLTKGSRRTNIEMQWSAQYVRNAPEHVLIAATFYSATNRWPLEIAFPIKKNGQPLYGVVPALTRPRGKAAP